jgi:hypothetical protein
MRRNENRVNAITKHWTPSPEQHTAPKTGSAVGIVLQQPGFGAVAHEAEADTETVKVKEAQAAPELAGEAEAWPDEEDVEGVASRNEVARLAEVVAAEAVAAQANAELEDSNSGPRLAPLLSDHLQRIVETTPKSDRADKTMPDAFAQPVAESPGFQLNIYAPVHGSITMVAPSESVSQAPDARTDDASLGPTHQAERNEFNKLLLWLSFGAFDAALASWLALRCWGVNLSFWEWILAFFFIAVQILAAYIGYNYDSKRLILWIQHLIDRFKN